MTSQTSAPYKIFGEIINAPWYNLTHYFPNQNSQTIVTPSLVFGFVKGEPDPLGHGTTHVITGSAMVTVVTGEGTYTQEADLICDRIVALFPKNRRIDELQIMRRPHVQDSYPDGGKWRTPIRIRYRIIE